MMTEPFGLIVISGKESVMFLRCIRWKTSAGCWG